MKLEAWPKVIAAVGRINEYGERLIIDDTASLTTRLCPGYPA